MLLMVFLEGLLEWYEFLHGGSCVLMGFYYNGCSTRDQKGICMGFRLY